MKVLVAPDSFKGTLSSREAAEAIAAGVQSALTGAEFEIVPLSDGGEGLVDSLLEALGGARRSATVTGPLGDSVEAGFGLLPDGETAVIEMAAASGLGLVPADRRGEAEQASTGGTGELILAALDAGARKIILGIGGSATTDGGAGCAQALGIGLVNQSGGAIERGGAGLAALHSIDLSTRDPRISRCQIEVACDVTNRLLGAEGAAAIFGPNKGLTPDGVRRMDANLAIMADVIERDLEIDVREFSGGGAAGGLGAGLVAFCGATLARGVERVLDACGIDKKIAEADILITGEGRLDRESAYGKVVAGLAARAQKHGVPVVSLVGISQINAAQGREMGLDAIHAVVRDGVSPEQAMAEPARHLEDLAREAAPDIAKRAASRPLASSPTRETQAD